MVRYNIDDVQETMILGQSMYLPTGELLLAAGYHIKPVYIERLRNLGYHYLYIQEPGTEDIVPEELISEHVTRDLQVSMSKSFDKLKSLGQFKDFSKRNVEQELEKNKDKFQDLVLNDTIKKSLKSIIDQIIENPNVVLNLSSLKSSDDYLYQHAINVAIMSVAIAKKFNFPREDMEALAIGALNADIGMLAVPKDVVTKGEALTEAEFALIKEHTAYGYLMLSQNPAIPPTASAVALQHHEKQDGSGYPRGLHGDNKPPYKTLDGTGKIHRFAEIVAVADAYDAIVSPRPYSVPAFPCTKAIETLVKGAGTHLNKAIVESFIEMIPTFPVGVKFRVIDCVSLALIGMMGVVAKLNPAKLDKPQLLLLLSRKGQRLETPRLLDMNKIPSLKIEILL